MLKNVVYCLLTWIDYYLKKNSSKFVLWDLEEQFQKSFEKRLLDDDDADDDDDDYIDDELYACYIYECNIYE